MQTKTRKILMALVGAYLIYTGITLIKDVMTGNPSNRTLFIIAGVFFALFGAVTLFMNLRAFIAESKKEMAAMEEENPEETDDEMVEEDVEEDEEESDGEVADAETAEELEEEIEEVAEKSEEESEEAAEEVEEAAGEETDVEDDSEEVKDN